MKITLIFMSIVLASCANVVGSRKAERILGSWELQDYGHGTYMFTQLGFTEDGRKCVVHYDVLPHAVLVDAWLNYWKVEGNMLVTTYGKSTTSTEPGYIMHDEIMSLSQSEMDLVMRKPETSAPSTEKHQKLDGVQPERICKIAEAIVRYRSK